MAGLVVAAIALSGCSSLGSRAFSDPTTTSSLPPTTPQSMNQPMPSTLGAPQNMTAEGQFLPPANIGGGGFVGQPASQPAWSMDS